MHSNRSFLILFFSLLINVSLFAQDDPKQLAKEYVVIAEDIMAETKALDDARDLMVLAADLDPENLKANFLAGYWHIQTINKEMAAKYLLRVYANNPDYRFDIEYWIGRSYHYGLDFDKAILFYNRYLEKLESQPGYKGTDKIDPKLVRRNIFECQNGKNYVANPVNYSIINLGSEINSEFEDYAPVLNEDETEIIFTSRRRDGNLNRNVDSDNKPYEDIFTAKKRGGAWTKAQNIGAPINTNFHDSNLSLSRDGQTLFLYYSVNNGDIFYSNLQRNGTWSAPVPLPGLVNSRFAETSISISSDESTIYFSSDRPGGYGGLDLYMATKDRNGAWSNIKNLGPKINTEFDEDGAFIDFEGNTLYFSSQGHAGMGGFDIFKSTYSADSKEWSIPENLGYPVNTADDDIFYTTTKDGSRAYYSSVRDDGFGYTDIYMITVPEAKQETTNTDKNILPLKLVVSVFDESSQPLDAKIKLESMPGNILMPQSRISAGVYQFTIGNESKSDYRLSVEQEGFMFQNQTISLPGATAQEQTIDRKVNMRKLSEGYSSILRNLYFDFDKTVLKDASNNELNKLERMMLQNASLKIEISGHTDNIGSKTYNKNLSQKRANAVKDFLVAKGIDTRRITAVGYGSEKPIASNDDEKDGRELNRRVEFKVLEN
jgi:outer membrane protein OmpA-like peptidoglycan-associated protein